MLAAVPSPAAPAAVTEKPSSGKLEERIPWAEFLARHDPVWGKPPQSFYEAPFLGNGMLGTSIRQSGPDELRWDIGRGDSEQHLPGIGTGGAQNRLPIGHFVLKFQGQITGCDLRLGLWNAELRGTVKTSKGSISICSLVHARDAAIFVEATPANGETVEWRWVPEEAIHPGAESERKNKSERFFNLPRNPEPFAVASSDGQMWVQPIRDRAETVTAWKIIRMGDTQRLYVTVAHTWHGESAQPEAQNTLRQITRADFDSWLSGHRDWWHAYYPASFLTLPDPYWESYYWIQIYKLACATRADGMVIDVTGPWLQPTPWPGTWWNLNVQLSYWAPVTGNRLELVESLRRSMREHLPDLIASVPSECRNDCAAIGHETGQSRLLSPISPPGSQAFEVGNLTWVCHNLWLYYRMSMDDAFLRDELYPLLRRSINFYLRSLETGADGKLHLPKTYSPEYDRTPDCNYDLSLLRWGLQTLLVATDRLKIDDPLRPTWRQTLEKLTEFPQDSTGLMIGRGMPYSRSHRHYSHLLMIYPLQVLTPEQPGGAELIDKSLTHWHALQGAHAGYSFTGGASIAAVLGQGDRALEFLERYKKYIKPNTMYQEAGPCIETPLSCAQSLHDMLLQSWGGTLRVFPAVPEAWKDVTFHNFRAEGAFLVSASRKDGKTRWVRLKSLAGEPCRIRVDGKDRTLKLAKGEEIVLGEGDCTVAPVPANPQQCNYFGVK